MRGFGRHGIREPIDPVPTNRLWTSPTAIDGIRPENQVRTELPAGGGSLERTRLGNGNLRNLEIRFRFRWVWNCCLALESAKNYSSFPWRVAPRSSLKPLLLCASSRMGIEQAGEFTV
jgi:hypothetical protein